MSRRKQAAVGIVLNIVGLAASASAMIYTTSRTKDGSPTVNRSSRMHEFEPPTITPGSGNFVGPVTVNLSASDPDVEIRYTTGFHETPGPESNLFAKPFEISDMGTVRAWAYKNGKPVSDIAVAYYTFFRKETLEAKYDWKDQPRKSALMIVFAHPDDEVISFRGTIPYYGTVRKLPIVTICMANNGDIEKDRLRRKELEAAMWAYGMRNRPIYANFRDCGYDQPISVGLEAWGMENCVRFLTEQIRRYKPDVILTHDFYGEYCHPNHVVTAIATYDAYLYASDRSKFPEQLKNHEPWQPKKLYAHLCRQESWEHDWDTHCPAMGGKTPQEVADEGIGYHYSQGASFMEHQGRRFGLVRSQVGPDVKKGDFFENV